MNDFQMSTQDTMSILSKYNCIQKHEIRNIKVNYDKYHQIYTLINNYICNLNVENENDPTKFIETILNNQLMAVILEIKEDED